MLNPSQAFLFCSTICVTTFAIAAPPIPEQRHAESVPSFIGTTATTNPIAAKPIPEHPYMAPNGRSNIHMDGYMSDTYSISGPLGNNTKVTSAFLAKIGGTITFDSSGRIITVLIAQDKIGLYLINPDTFGVEAVQPLPRAREKKDEERQKNVTKEISGVDIDFGAGGYFFLDNKDRAIVPTRNQQIWIIAEEKKDNKIVFKVEKIFDLNLVLSPKNGTIQSVLPDGNGLLWFTVSGNSKNPIRYPGIVGTIKFDPNYAGKEAIHLYPLKGEAISKSFAVDPKGGAYIVSNHQLYRFDAAANGAPIITWQSTYDRGKRIKPGQIQMGSGTTPTLLGEDYVAIADNADPYMHVDVFSRNNGKLVCEQPVFSAFKGATENSLIGFDQSIIVENNYGYYSILATQFGRTTQPGISRIDINTTIDPNVKNNCSVVWTNTTESIPSVVSQLSLANGLIYTYTKSEGPHQTDAWYFTAIDYKTGKTIYKQLAGTGLLYNNHYSGVYLGPDQSAYVGVVGGFIKIRDQ